MTRPIQTGIVICAAITIFAMQNLHAEPVREAQHLQVLLAMDTDATTIADGVKADFQLLSTVLNEIRSEHPNKVLIKVMTGADVTPENVLAHYKSLRIGDEESLLFIYSGHGGIDPIQGQFLAMRRGPLDRSDLRVAMDNTGAGLRVILSNCCSNIAGIDPPNRRIPAAWEGFKQLFFQHRGLVDITAASDKTFAWVSSKHGGLFTQCLARLFCEPIESTDENGDGFVSWDEFASVLSNDTNMLFLQTRNGEGINDSDPDHISHFESQIPKAYCTGFCDWQQASLHHQLRAALWEGEALLNAIAAYQHLDPKRASPRGAEAKLRQAAPYAARASVFFSNAANHQSRAVNSAIRYQSSADIALLSRRVSDFERQAVAYNTVAQRRRRTD